MNMCQHERPKAHRCGPVGNRALEAVQTVSAMGHIESIEL